MSKGKKIAYTPRWAGPIEGHAVNTVKKFFPSLCAEHEFDDLMQEAYLVYMRCKARFKGDTGAWFMAFFSRSLANRLINLKAKTGRMISLEDCTIVEAAGDAEDAFMQAAVVELLQRCEGASRTRLLPDSIRQLVSEVCNGPVAEGRAAYRKLVELFPSLA